MQDRARCHALYGLWFVQCDVSGGNILRNERQEGAPEPPERQGRGSIQAYVELHALRKMHYGLSERHQHKTYHSFDMPHI